MKPSDAWASLEKAIQLLNDEIAEKDAKIALLEAALKAADDHESHWQKIALEYMERIDELRAKVEAFEDKVMAEDK